MYLHNLKLWNFRKYGIKGESFDSAEPGLSVQFNKGVNVLVGENDSGKTTIIDAIRYILRTQSLEYIQVDEKDFYQDKGGLRTNELKIECTFKGFADKEAGHFLEWLGFESISDGKHDYILKVWLFAINKDNSIYQYVRAGVDSEGSYLEGDARELLRVVYLKPLRDALSEMTHGNKSRLAQILKSHSVFKKEKNAAGQEQKHELEVSYKKLKDEIDNFFDPKRNNKGKKITNSINDFLGNDFLLQSDTRKAGINLTGSELIDILRQLDLILEDNKSGLGSLNLLFIAAELLLFNETRNGLKLTLIEELEAHLHPQYQLRLIDFINKKEEFGQFILTTHSTTLASKIKLENLIVCKDKMVYPMGHAHTQLEESDYKFLERFLDATKANLFFAKGVIIVEGDAENLLIPTIAKLIDRPLHKYGVSIVNVGSTAFKRYAKIFLRKDKADFNVPVSIITDLDIRSYEYYTFNEENTEKGKIPQIVLVDEEFIKLLKGITKDVNYDNLLSFYYSKQDFKDYFKFNKTVDRFPRQVAGAKSIIDQLSEVYQQELQNITPKIISSLRDTKKLKIKKEWENKGNVEIFVPEQWTLEYELASSKLYKYLIQATLVAKAEKNNPQKIIDKTFLIEIKDEVERACQDDVLTDPNKIYKIFYPVSNGNISKASTAQYFAEILDSTSEIDDTLFEKLKSDPYLEYLCDAIYHVTEPKLEAHE